MTTRICKGPCGRLLALSLFPKKGERRRSICTTCFNDKRRDQHGRSPIGDPDMVRLVEAAKKHPTFEALCDALDLAPKKCSALLKRAAERNAPIHVEHNTISVAPSPAVEVVQDIFITHPRGEPFKALLISDTHMGSKYCLRNAIRETVNWGYEQGARDVLHVGDILDGCYRHGQFELSHVGFDEQLRDAFNTFPRRKDLRYHFITGNHDYTFEEHTGMRCGVAIETGMRALGRNDWLCYGDRNAYIRLGGVVVNPWHPRGGGAYARSYNSQKKIEGYTAIKPHILLVGHYHQFCYIYERGIHAFQMPSFQGSGSNFAQSLKGGPSIGGILVEWQLSETGRIHDLTFTPRFFFERDEIFNPRNELTMTEVKAIGRERRYRKDKEVS